MAYKTDKTESHNPRLGDCGRSPGERVEDHCIFFQRGNSTDALLSVPFARDPGPATQSDALCGEPVEFASPAEERLYKQALRSGEFSPRKGWRKRKPSRKRR